MMRTLLIATGLTLFAASTQAVELFPHFRWDGSMHVTGQTEDCGGLFFSPNNDRASFYPKLDSNYPSSSFTRMRDGEAELIQKDSSYGQFNGTGNYISFTIAGGGFTKFPSDYDEYESSGQTYSFTQTPATVTADTVFVTLTGTLDNYRGVEGCSVTLTGTFVRVDPPQID
jgi:hypothetical protein